ncbi:MAG: 3-hydroxyacyl-CoA dehydrogenase NAD-binding domain-containing protein [Gammaproteobacteria bacterium]|nr:3-hydroxyacyl-CoA dehydrogenase NAD-binding domain-containing protein [Gammaproteobacteria bacterium]
MSKHWKREDQASYSIITLDMADGSANVLGYEVLNELDEMLAELETNMPAGLVIRSGKQNGFIYGANVKEFTNIDSPDKAAELAARGQAIFARLERLRCPTVAVIHGQCLGGGTELALACNYRVMRDDPGTRIGLPEVMLGINPGFGGTVRLPKLVGAPAAMDMMLTGRAMPGKLARKIGLVDEVVPERYLMQAATTLLTKRPRHRLALWKRALGLPGARNLVAGALEKKVRQKANPDHYPAPYRIIDLWRSGSAYAQEATSLGELLTGRTSRNLVRVFLLSEELKRKGRAVDHNIKHVHVIGAGVMGGDIAAWAAHKGFSVSLQDRSAEAIGRAMKRANDFYQKKYRKDSRQVEAAMDRLMPDLNGDGLRRADLVVEAIIENEAAKQGLFKDVEKKVKPDCVLATNTSSIPLEIIGEALEDPSRLVGLHFFNPVAKMQLVEIVRGAQTSDDVMARARSFTTSLERLPLDVKSSPGFLVNRILMPYLIEAMILHQEGVPLAEIDQAAVDFGMPMGPIHLADTVGLDICLSVAQELSGPLGITVPDGLKQMVDTGKLGRKSGEGFYQYKKGQPVRTKTGNSSAIPVSERLILRLLNEAMACLREQVVDSADEVDAGMVYGTGFAPFLGGPMHYAGSMGAAGISHSLGRLADEYGERFKPDTGWDSNSLPAI